MSSSSNLQKALRAVDGDEWFPQRVEVACTLGGREFSRRLALQVAMENAEAIRMVEEPDLVDTTGVTDAMIFTSLEAIPVPEDHPEVSRIPRED